MNIIPERLLQGDLIGVIAPAGPVTPPEIQPAIQILRERGYKVLEGPHLYRRQGYLAGSDEDRLDDLHLMFRHGEVKAVLCARGGYGTPRLLEKIDYDLIRQNPRILIGYSDITALLLAVYHRTGLVVYHGPMAKGMAAASQDNIDLLLGLLSSGSNTGFELDQRNVLRGGKARGRMLGGNLSMLASLAGTSFLPSFKSRIMLIEERGEPLYRIDRMLTQLRLSGVLDGLEAVIAGNFIDCGDIMDVNNLIIDLIPGACPVYSGFPIGHGDDNRVLPLGVEAVLDTEGLYLSITEACVK